MQTQLAAGLIPKVSQVLDHFRKGWLAGTDEEQAAHLAEAMQRAGVAPAPPPANLVLVRLLLLYGMAVHP